jgi:lactate dehydrogenase-like 2-hydroxyacid dehydrogenase
LILGGASPEAHSQLEQAFDAHSLENEEFDSLKDRAGKIEAMAVMHVTGRIDAPLMRRLPALRLIASFGVGYDHIDAAAAAGLRILVTNTPDVLTEEVADTALGLLLATVRELPQAMNYLLAGHWPKAPYPLTKATLRDRTVGLVGMGRIGQAIAERLMAFKVPVVYHTRHPNPAVPYRHYGNLIAMASAVDTLIVIVPGGASTKNLIDETVLEALGPRGILINVARGSVVDEAALIDALTRRRIFAAGLDVFQEEPQVPEALMRLDNVVLLPHVGSASVYTRARMEQRVVDNLLAWAAGKDLISPVAESRELTPRRL